MSKKGYATNDCMLQSQHGDEAGWGTKKRKKRGGGISTMPQTPIISYIRVGGGATHYLTMV